MGDFYDMNPEDQPFRMGVRTDAQEVAYNVTDVVCPLCHFTVDGGEAVVLPGCHHSVCLICFQEHIQSSQARSVPICCPLGTKTECFQSLDQSLLLQLKATELQATTRSAPAVEERSSVYHQCPSLGCTNLVYWKEGNGPPIGDCFRCNKTFCLKCGAIPFHQSKTCQQYHVHLQACSLRPLGKPVAPSHLIEDRGERNTRRCSF